MYKVFLLTLLVPLSSAIQRAVQWQRDPQTNKEYAVIHTDLLMDFDTSRAVCRAVLGNLPEPRTPEENQFVFNMLNAKFFLGMRDSDSEGQWRWVSDGSNVTWTNWKTAGSRPEPNGDRSENCAIFADKHPDGDWAEWGDKSCGDSLSRVVCEKSRSCHNRMGQCIFDQGIRNIIAPNLQRRCSRTSRDEIETCISAVECSSPEEHQREAEFHRRWTEEMCNIRTINWTAWATQTSCRNNLEMEIEAVKQVKQCESHITGNATQFCSDVDAMLACWVNDVADKCSAAPYNKYVREITRASLKVSKATLMKKYTEAPYDCSLNIPEEQLSLL